MSEKLAALLSSFEINDSTDKKSAFDIIILREKKKRLGKMDMDLIAECVNLILEIDGVDKEKLADTEAELAEEIVHQVKSEEAERTSQKRHRYPRHVLIPVFIIAVALAVTALVAGAMGYSVVDLGKKIIGIPVNIPLDYNGNDVIRTDDVMSYDSIEALLADEKLQILFPETLPDGYDLRRFTVRNFGGETKIFAAGSGQKYIELTITVGVNLFDNNYPFEENGIEYNIADNENGTYQAWWYDGTNSYALIIDDESIILGIIAELKEF